MLYIIALHACNTRGSSSSRVVNHGMRRASRRIAGCGAPVVAGLSPATPNRNPNVHSTIAGACTSHVTADEAHMLQAAAVILPNEASHAGPSAATDEEARVLYVAGWGSNL